MMNFQLFLVYTKDVANATPLTQVIQAVLGRRIPFASSERIDVPDVISNILQKMTQKQIDDRYHSMSGVKHDLIEVQRLLGEGDNEGLFNFRIGSKDVSSFFVLPTSIFGRDRERKKVVEVIENIAIWQDKQDKTVASSKIFGSASGNSTLSERLDSTEIITRSSDTSSQVGTSPALGPSSFAIVAAQEPHTGSQDFSNGSAPTTKPPLEVHDSRESIATTYSYDTFNTQKSGGYSEYPNSGLQNGTTQISRGRGSQRRLRRHRCEIISVTGAAGVGKTSLIQSAQVEIRKWGYFASAKFDPARKAPYEPLLRAMSSLFRQIFSESDVNSEYHNMIRQNTRGFWGSVCSMLNLPEHLMSTDAQWNSKIPAATLHGANKSLKVEMAETESLRSMPNSSVDAEAYSSTDVRMANPRSLKFVSVFIEVLRILSTSKLICLCLDDINYADEESLDLVTNIMEKRLGIIILTTCREEGALPRNVEHIMNSKAANVTSVKLAPLTEQEVINYVSTTLCRPAEYILPLAMVCLEKSNGNPFYLRQMLEACHRKGCIWYSWKESIWDFDLDRVFAEFESSSYGERLDTTFVTKRLQDLPSAARAILAWASLLGTSFSFLLVQRLLSGEFDYVEEEEDESNPAKAMEPFAPQPVKNIVEGLQATLQVCY